MKNEESFALAHPPTGGGEWGWSEGAPGQYRPPNLILTQSLHLKHTCGKRTVSNLLPFILFTILSFIIL